ncbi:hypothetical protein, partial [Sulfurimonas indica]|uniref:hypothetical protein n=1 Tax=Sulfurimonas indica TaxID=2508707 RepID=UPI0012648151
MIHHYSIAVANTKEVAGVLNEIFQGHVTKFRPRENSYMVWFDDAYGSAIELYPLKTEMLPGENEQAAQFVSNEEASGYSATHAAISVALDKKSIFQLARSLGWRAVELPRGHFNAPIQPINAISTS